MTHYVLGVAVNGDNVVLINKNRPEWQKGKLNFPGGKTELLPPEVGQIHERADWETAEVAMAREFQEEAGVVTDPTHWKQFGSIKGKDYYISLMYIETDAILVADTQTDEEIMLADIEELLNGDFEFVTGRKLVHNVKLLLQFAVIEWARFGAKINLEYP